MELKKNTLLNRKYRVIKTISSSGGFSYIYLCRDNANRKRVAVKELYPEKAVLRCGREIVVVNQEKFDTIQDSFTQEAEILRELKHDSIISYVDFFIENNTCYLVYEYARGRTLKDYIVEQNKITNEALMGILKELLKTIQYLHEKDILHRDIKPGNILLFKGKIKLIDFGSSTYINDRKDKFLKITEGFSPIELYSTDSPQSYSSDIYSIFATLYYLIEGKKLPSSPKRFFDDDIEFNNLKSDSLKNIIVKNLSVDFKNRNKSVDELIENLQENCSLRSLS